MGVLASLGSIRGGIRPWDLFVTNAGLVAIVDAILSGVIATLVVSAANGSERLAAVVGVVAGAIVFGLLTLYLARNWRAAIRTFGVRFTPDRAFAESHPADDPGAAERQEPPAR